jgi:hypothetical protein
VSIYIVFDGPPSHESGRFVEVEDEQRHGLGPSATGADWAQRDDGCWTLGPFARAEGVACCTCGHELSVHTRFRLGLNDACSLCACTGVVRVVPDRVEAESAMDMSGVLEGARLGHAEVGS